VGEAVECLWSEDGKKAMDYLKQQRSLEEATIGQWRLGVIPEDRKVPGKVWGLPGNEQVWIPKGILIPCIDALGSHYLKVRRPTGEPKYTTVKGSHAWIYGTQSIRDASVCFLFEGEFDALISWQTELRIGSCALPAGQMLKGEWSPFFTLVEFLLVAYDNDPPGQAAAARMCELSPRFLQAKPLPYGKDLTEYHQGGGDILQWQLDALAELDRTLYGSGKRD